MLCLLLLLHSPPAVNSSESFSWRNDNMLLYPNHAFETCRLLDSSYISTSGASFESQWHMSDMCHFHVCTHLFSPKSPISPVFFSLRDFNVPIRHVSLRYFGGWIILGRMPGFAYAVWGSNCMRLHGMIPCRVASICTPLLVFVH
jgi:hypothetical protein